MKFMYNIDKQQIVDFNRQDFFDGYNKIFCQIILHELSLCTVYVCIVIRDFSRVSRPFRTGGESESSKTRERSRHRCNGRTDETLHDVRDARYVDAYTQDSERYTSVHYRNGAHDANVTSIMRQ